MRILLINHYAGSPQHGMEYRPYYLAREWVAAGHQVRIVAASYSHLRQRQPMADGSQQEIIDGIDYRWLATPAYAGNGLGRAWNIGRFLLALQSQAARLAAEFAPELVIASSTYPADIWPAAAIARRARARLIFEVHDLWPLSPMELGPMPRWHPFIQWMQAAEHYAYRHAQRVVSILPKVAEHTTAHGLAPDKLHIVPNGVAVRDWQLAQAPLDGPAAALLARLRAQGRIIVGYAGSHGTANALSTLLQAAARLRRCALSVVLVGDGPDKPELQAEAAQLGLEHVHFLPPVPRAQVPALLARFDLAYLGWPRRALYRFGIAPNKLGDYMMAACPVVHAVEAGNDPVREAGCGLSVPPADPAALARALRHLAQLPAAARARLGQRGRDYALQHLDYAVLAQRFLTACVEDPS